jgi:NAD(P)H-flavin reductase
MSAAALDALVPTPRRVVGRTREVAGSLTVELVPEGGAIPAFLPGQFNMLYAFGRGEVAISLSGDPADRSRIVHTVRPVGAVSTAIANLEVGGVIGVRGPYGSAWPMQEALGRDVVVVAGGLGLAPLRPAIYHLLRVREHYGRVIILAGMRRPDEILFRNELEGWRGRLDVEVHVTVDHADPGWHGNVGVVPALIPRASFDPARAIALVCGPEIMMRYAAGTLQDAGVSPDRIYVSMERNMKCAIGLCGHCQFGPTFVCKDGAVMRLDRIAGLLSVAEI